MKLALPAFLAVAVASCASTVLVKVDPRMNLDHELPIGIVAFDVEGDAGGTDVSLSFIEAIHEGQPGVAVVELGRASEVLEAIGHTRLDGEAARAIGEKFGVQAVLVGNVALRESKPKVDLDFNHGFQLGSVQAQVRLDGSLEAKLLSADRGATVWSGSSSRWIQLSCVSGNSSGAASVDIADRSRQVQRLLYDMVQEATADFRPTWERRRAP